MGVVAKGLALLLCAFSFCWAVDVFWVRLDARALNAIAANVAGGQSYEPEVLTRVVEPALALRDTGALCQASALRSAAIVAVALYEDAGAPLSADDPTWRAARAAVGRALACTPTDGYLWLAQFRLEVAVERMSGLLLDYLGMSFKLAPNEGWVMDRRAALAAPLWDSYPDEMKARFIKDFTLIAQSLGPWKARLYLDRLTPPMRRTFVAALETLSSDVLDRMAPAFAGSDILPLTEPLAAWVATRYCPTKAGRLDVRCTK